MIQSCQIYKAEGEGIIWEMPPILAKKLNLEEELLITLKCGALSVLAKVIIARVSFNTTQSMGLSEDALAALKIPQYLNFSIKPVNIEQYRIGPVIGILTFSHVIRKNQLNRYIKYALTMKDTGLLYVFRPRDIHPETRTITGFHFNEDKKSWESGEFPYPDVVIDRTYPNNYKAHSKLEKVIGPNKIFNKKTLINKIEFNTVMEKDPYLKNFIPETKIFESSNELDDFLNKYNGVFLKPSDSMRGRGIINITREQNALLCKYMDGDRCITKKIPRTEYIFEVLGHFNEFRRPYIIQASVPRMTFMDRPFCFRVMTTKNGGGRWCVPIIIAKASRPGLFLTNISSGADYVLIKKISKLVRQQLPHKNINLLEQLTDLTLKAATALDKEFGPLGKLGIDAVIDVSGKLWLIEANGNPGLIFRRGQTEFPDWRHQSYEHPIAYALFLAGFSKL